jgi:hypothetical protein
MGWWIVGYFVVGLVLTFVGAVASLVKDPDDVGTAAIIGSIALVAWPLGLFLVAIVWTADAIRTKQENRKRAASTLTGRER